MHQVELIRPEDLLVLTLTYHGFTLRTDYPVSETDPGGETTITALVRDPGMDAYLVVEFPPQHIAEEITAAAGPASIPVPTGIVGSMLSGPSRIVFDIPTDIQTILYTVKDILKFGGFAPNAATSFDDVTQLEIPFGLVISTHREVVFPSGTSFVLPEDTSLRWKHMLLPVTRNGRTDLWTTRATVDAPVTNPLRMRAINSLPDPPPMPGGASFPIAADAPTRKQIVANSGDDPFVVNDIALSALGAWFSAQGSWPDAPNGLIAWKHDTAMGRDEYVQIVEDGFCHRWGLPARCTQTTTRRILGNANGIPVAFLSTRTDLEILDPARDFDKHTLPFTRVLTRSTQINYVVNYADIKTPVTLTSPFLIAVSGPGGGATPFVFDNHATDHAEETHPIPHYDVWVPKGYTGSADALVALLPDAQKLDTRITGFATASAMPLALAGRAVAYAPPSADKPAATAFPTDTMAFVAGVLTSPLNSIPPPSLHSADVTLPSVAQLGVAATTTVAYAKEYVASGGFAVLDAAQQGLEELKRQGRQLEYDVLSAAVATGGAAVLDAAQQGLKALKQRGEQVEAEYNALYEWVTKGNPGTVFLALAAGNALPLPFPADKAGGLAAPAMDVAGLSRTFGSVGGDVSKLAGGQFDPASYFANAKVLGTIPLARILLADVLNKAKELTGADHAIIETITELQNTRGAKEAELQKAVGTVKQDLEKKMKDLSGQVESLLSVQFVKVPVLTTHVIPGPPGVAGVPSLPTAVETRFLWKPEIKDFGPFKAEIAATETEPRKQAQLVLRGAFRVRRDGGTPEYEINGTLTQFALEIADVVRVEFKQFKFTAAANVSPAIDVQLGPITFLGALDFMSKLRDLIPSDGFGGAGSFTIDPSPSGVKAAYSLRVPPITLGVFSITDIALAASVSIPFTGDRPVGMRFAISSRERPFNATVLIVGGGGHFALAVDATGQPDVEASIECGGNFSLDLIVASGNVHIMVGVYFIMDHKSVRLGGYFRCGGSVSVLAIASVSVEFYLALEYDFTRGDLWGRAKITLTVSVLCFSKTFELEVEKRLAGSGGAPAAPKTAMPLHALLLAPSASKETEPSAGAARDSLSEQMSHTEWGVYWDAFAPA